MWVANDGQREPAASSSCSTASASSAIVTPGTTSGADGGHRRLDRRDRAAHRGELLVGLRPAELVDEARAGPQPLEADGAAEAERGLGPDAVADRDRPSPSSSFATRSKIAAPSSVSLTTITSPAGSSRRSNAANMRGKRKTGSRPGRKNAPVTQPCA